MSASTINRPLKFGPQDRREYIVQDSEVSLRALNDANGSPIYLGRAKAGVTDSMRKWQIRKIEYDSFEGVISITWPQDDEGNASTNYEFVWSSQSPVSVISVTQANPGVVTVTSAAGLSNGDLVYFLGAEGMTEINYDGSNLYTVANIAGNQFELSGTNTSGYGAYTGSGMVYFPSFLNYTYS